MRLACTIAHLACVPGRADQGAFGGGVGVRGVVRGVLRVRFLAERAENLRLFAAHHVGQLAALQHARHDMQRHAACRLHSDDAGHQRFGTRRRLDVRRFDPALRAADHAGCDHRHAGRLLEPRAAGIFESCVETALFGGARQIHDAGRRCVRGQHVTAGIEEIRAQRGRAPVERDQRGLAEIGRDDIRHLYRLCGDGRVSRCGGTR